MYAALGMRSMMGAGRFVGSGYGLGGFAWFGHAAFVLIVLAGIAVLAWALLRRPRHTTSITQAVSAVDAASAIARERLARGEIEPDQYLAIVAALNGQSGVAQPSAPSETTSLPG